MSNRYRFHCHSCQSDVVVDGRVRDSMLHSGCLICNSPVSATDFEVMDSPPGEYSPQS